MKKKIIWSVIAIIIIIAAVMGILYFTTDMFKSPEQLFYKRLADDTNFLGKTTYADIMKETKSKLEAATENQGEVTAKITSTDPSVKQAGQILEKGKITYNVKNLGTEQKMQGDFTLNYDGKDIVTLNVLQNKDQYGIKVADAYDKYVSVENNNLKALFQKLGIDASNVPDKFEMVDYYELLNIDEAMIKHIEDTYSTVIKQNIPAESYTVEKNVVVKMDNTDVTTNAYKLTLTEEQTKTVVTKLLETLKSDDKTLDLIISKYNMMFEPYKAMGLQMSGTTELTKDSFVEAINDEIENLNRLTAESGNMLEVIAYGAKDNKAKIVINVMGNEESLALVSMDMVKENVDKKLNKKAIVNLVAEDMEMTVQTVENNEKTETGIVILAEDASMTARVTMNEDKSSEIGMAISSEGTTMELNIKDEVKSTTNVTVEEFTTENSVKLNDMTQNEMATLIQTIATNVQKVLPQKAQLLGINL